ncbi:hypothetical protein AVEN_56124-1 [Araneus ventricosus]|uniref:Uncharacterized protein n=1 Tax=Araneus ventricosus TaxID=182803 RepID=A0A4Y2QXV3_ARAVE|nr:hypothetical protein AVEN_238773-1 [Araneus ventricosus]GBN68234.1 hypothetical protein AVEN_56124-1 [Araneus ventricosus]
MATDPKRKKYLRLERERLTRYQHQHRGLNFLKLWLPPAADRKVNIIGLNNHIYKGKIPTVPLDQLPPEVDPKSIDEEELYKEIRDMRFPIVPPLRPLGPARRIGGEYTTAKRMAFAPVQISLDDDKTEMPILGADGKVYQGRSKAVPVQELDRRLRGTNRPVKTPAMYGSDRGTVKPTVVSLYVDGKPPSERKTPVPLIQLPYADLNKLTKLMKIESPEQEATRSERTVDEPAEQEKDSKPTETEESEGESSREFTSSESVGAAGEASDVEGSSTTTVTEGSSEVTDLVSEGDETDVEVSEPELSESEPEEEKHEVTELEFSESEPEQEKHEVSEPELSESEPEEEKHPEEI